MICYIAIATEYYTKVQLWCTFNISHNESNILNATTSWYHHTCYGICQEFEGYHGITTTSGIGKHLPHTFWTIFKWTKEEDDPNQIICSLEEMYMPSICWLIPNYNTLQEEKLKEHLQDWLKKVKSGRSNSARRLSTCLQSNEFWNNWSKPTDMQARTSWTWGKIYSKEHWESHRQEDPGMNLLLFQWTQWHPHRWHACSIR